MGGELAQQREWNHDTQLDWPALSDPLHGGIQHLVRDLNRLYVSEPALHVHDGAARGFQWLIGDDAANSVFAYLRCGDDGDAPLLAVCNFTPVPRSEEHTSELQSLLRISYAVFCLKKKKNIPT